MDESMILFEITITLGEMVIFSIVAGAALAIFEQYIRKYTWQEIFTTVQKYVIITKL